MTLVMYALGSVVALPALVALYAVFLLAKGQAAREELDDDFHHAGPDDGADDVPHPHELAGQEAAYCDTCDVLLTAGDTVIFTPDGRTVCTDPDCMGDCS